MKWGFQRGHCLPKPNLNYGNRHLVVGEGKGGENITPGYEERAVSFNKNICNNKVSIIN